MINSLCTKCGNAKGVPVGIGGMIAHACEDCFAAWQKVRIDILDIPTKFRKKTILCWWKGWGDCDSCKTRYICWTSKFWQ